MVGLLLTHSRMGLLTHAWAYSLTHGLTHSRTGLLTHSPLLLTHLSYSPTHLSSSPPGTPTVADLDGNGRYEVLIGTSLGLLYLLDGDTGFVRRYFPMQFHEIQAQIAVADVHGGPDLEIIVADMGGNLVLVNIEGDTLWYSLTHSPNHLLTHSPNHLLTHSPNHLLTHPLTHSLTQGCAPLRYTASYAYSWGCGWRRGSGYSRCSGTRP